MKSNLQKILVICILALLIFGNIFIAKKYYSLKNEYHSVMRQKNSLLLENTALQKKVRLLSEISQRLYGEKENLEAKLNETKAE